MKIAAFQTQRGMTLIECMIALTLGMLITLAATALLLSAQKTYLAIDDSARIGDTGAFAMDVLAAAIRQTAYADRSVHRGGTAVPKPPENMLFGFDDASLKGKYLDFAEHRTPGVNHSDALITRFMTTDATGSIDENMRNCAGQAAKTALIEDTLYSWSIFYIAEDKSGEPQLFCKYRTKKLNFDASAIAGGVENVQFQYGVDFNGDGLPDTFIDANAVGAKDWSNVVAIDIALTIYGKRSHSHRQFHRMVALRNRSDSHDRRNDRRNRDDTE
jgi:type IV pilus assembly protein PilW